MSTGTAVAPPVAEPRARERRDFVPSQTTASGSVVVGISGARRNGAVAVAVGGELTAFCELERVTRIRRAPLCPGRLPHDVLNAALATTGHTRDDVRCYAFAEEGVILPPDVQCVRMDHHLGHAATAFYASPSDDAAVLICDQSTTGVSVWHGCAGQLTNVQWPWEGPGFAALYSQSAELLGFPPGQHHRFEALAQVGEGPHFSRLSSCFQHRDGSLQPRPDWKLQVRRELAEFGPARDIGRGASVAAALQRQLGDELLALVSQIRDVLPVRDLCLGGGLFYNTYFNTLLSESGRFERTFVAPNPGNAGIAAGAALAATPAGTAARRQPVSPFLGPEYDIEAIKATLDNCKLSYECLSEREVVDRVVDALMGGRLVGWFNGRMEWAHRALGGRSILANPFSPYTLENLNAYLKQRDRYRAYGLSVCEEDLSRYFVGPDRSRWMEYEYALRDRELFRHIVPATAKRVRVQSVPIESRVFHELHRAFAAKTGTGVLVNTSFNGFSEPIVCSPRDAIRVFFGTGLDLLVLGGRFLVTK
jgi:carbamoyltransferase